MKRLSCAEASSSLVAACMADARARVCAGSSYNPSNEILSMINKGGQVRRGTGTAVALPPSGLPGD